MAALIRRMAFMILVVIGENVVAANHYVAVTGTNSVAPFLTWDTAATNIQDAIDVSGAGDFVTVSNGVYKFGGRAVYGVATNRVTVDRPVTVQSVNGPPATTIVGVFGVGLASTHYVRCAYLTNGACLVGFTLTGGGARTTGDLTNEQSGAGAWCEPGGVISNCVVIGNTAAAFQGMGGGVYGGTIWNSTIKSNSAYFGAGVAEATVNNSLLVTNVVYPSGSAAGGGAYGSTLSNCWLVNNGGDGDGGGVSGCVVYRSVLSNNSCWYLGGGAYNSWLLYSKLVGNSAGEGGGANLGNVYDCLVVSNRTTSNGGGAYQSALVNCTVVGNSAGNSGGGIYLGTAHNCILYYNSAPVGSNYVAGTMEYCCTIPTNDATAFTNEPVFVDAANGDFHEQTNSPTINNGWNNYVPSFPLPQVDFEGNPRIVGTSVDVGAYEYQGSNLTVAGIPFWWLRQNGLPADGSADYLDSDGDGLNNWQEWIAGTLPGSAASVLQMISAMPTNHLSGVTVTWQSVNGQIYYLDRSCDLSGGFSTVQSNLVGQAGTTTVTDTTATNSSPYFYRVGVQ